MMRRDPLEIIEQMFKILERERQAMSINQIAKKTGLHNVTVKRYVKIIQTIRDEPELDVIRTRHSIILRVEKRSKREE
jgi:response regulator of citrate/malate metabolism